MTPTDQVTVMDWWSGTLIIPLSNTPWGNRNGWLGVKHQVTYLPLSNLHAEVMTRTDQVTVTDWWSGTLLIPLSNLHAEVMTLTDQVTVTGWWSGTLLILEHNQTVTSPLTSLARLPDCWHGSSCPGRRCRRDGTTPEWSPLAPSWNAWWSSCPETIKMILIMVRMTLLILP